MEQLMEREVESHGKEGRADKNGKTEVEAKLQQDGNMTDTVESG